MAKSIWKSKRSKSLIVIPARMVSTRLFGKPMLTVAGKPLVQWTYERAKQTDADYVMVATPDREVAQYCQNNGLVWMLTGPDHPNGTSRVAEVFGKLHPEDKRQICTIVNWQVDEPVVSPTAVNMLLPLHVRAVSTLVCPICESPRDPNRVKVVYSQDRCHWFSRAPMAGAGSHIGIYAFCPFLLQMISLLRPSRLAKLESLEQLTWIENGVMIRPVEIDTEPLSINDDTSWQAFRELKEGGNASGD